VAGSTLIDLLRGAVDRHGRAVAVEQGTWSIRYEELWHRAGRLAAGLASVGVVAGARVAISVDGEPSGMVAAWGCLRAAAAYVPLDLVGAGEWHLARLAHADVAAIVGSVDHREEIEGIGRRLGRPVLLLAPGGVVATGAGGTSHVPAHGADDHAPVVLLFTSGSTSEPKAAVHTHRSVRAIVDWMIEVVVPTREDRVLASGPLDTDLSFTYLFVGPAGGATAVFAETSVAVPALAAAALQTRQISVAFMTPRLLLPVAELPSGSLPALRHVTFGGERMPVGTLRRLAAVAPAASFVNVYGTTESGLCTAEHVDLGSLDDGGELPIGRPIADADVLIVDDDGRPVGPRHDGEVTGEIWVSGPAMMAGYWNDDARTRRAFRVSQGSPTRYYSTGDMVTISAAGDWLFAGRRDDQFKRAGRIVTQRELEASIERCDGVVACSVVASVAPDGNATRLVAHVQLDGTRSPGDVLQHLARDVPAYMVPDEIREVASLPLTRMGKVDRRRLRSLGVSADRGGEVSAESPR
jgi:acyl-CoA synthetase (AMP-forming)/AMP-acid ligase II